jgi:hypothetical protein
LSDAELAKVGLDEVPDGQSQRWLLLHIRRAALMLARSLTQYAQHRKSATAGAWARALEAAARALVEA